MRSTTVSMLGAVVAALAVGAGPASAATTVDWHAHLAEPIGGPFHSPFTCPINTPCGSGSGEVVGLGYAEDFVAFGACGPTCDVRTLTFADASTLVMHETISNFQTPGRSSKPHSNFTYGNPFSGDLSDTIVGGTGRFDGASGAARGTVKVAGGGATVTLAGTVTFGGAP